MTLCEIVWDIYKPHVTEMQENYFLNLFSYNNSFKEYNYLFSCGKLQKKCFFKNTIKKKNVGIFIFSVNSHWLPSNLALDNQRSLTNCKCNFQQATQIYRYILLFIHVKQG